MAVTKKLNGERDLARKATDRLVAANKALKLARGNEIAAAQAEVEAAEAEWTIRLKKAYRAATEEEKRLPNVKTEPKPKRKRG